MHPGGTLPLPLFSPHSYLPSPNHHFSSSPHYTPPLLISPHDPPDHFTFPILLPSHIYLPRLILNLPSPNPIHHSHYILNFFFTVNILRFEPPSSGSGVRVPLHLTTQHLLKDNAIFCGIINYSPQSPLSQKVNFS